MNTTDADRTNPAAQNLSTVVIVGRPNVGKSTLFNRFVGERAAIVEDRPGVTRDRKELTVEWLGRNFLLVDTGGWLPKGSELDIKVSRQVEVAVRSADLVLFLVDGSVGVNDEDEAIASWLRRTQVPVLVVVNKADNDRRETDRWEFLSLGLGEPHPVSALHGRRAGDLLDVILDQLPEEGSSFDDDSDIRSTSGHDDVHSVDAESQSAPKVALVGRPNVGKSTLFNRLVGEDRSVVHDMPGTTRDSVNTLVDTPDGPVLFVDTAGMRRKSRIDDSAEYYSLVRALRSIDDADVALLVIDATQGITAQDQRLAERIDAAGCPIVVMLNKWDLMTTQEERDIIDAEMSRKLSFVGGAPILKISALSGRGVHRLRPVLQDAITQYHRRIPTKDVNRILSDAQQRQPAGGGAKVLYALQGATDPPTFTLFVNRDLPPPYLRYLERSIREAFNFGSTPLKLRVRRRSE
jgi:GTP-binding protein